jgi:transcriptional regulator with XRE-family HTH domain
VVLQCLSASGRVQRAVLPCSLRGAMTRRGLPLRGKKLRDLRLARELKQDEAAKRLHVSLKTYGNWENAGRDLGGRAEPAHIAALAEFYGVAQDELIAPGFAPPEPIRTAEEALGAIQQQLLDLSGAVGRVALGVEVLVQRSAGQPASRGSRTKRSGRANPQAG